MVDVVGATLGLIVTAPLMVMAAMSVALNLGLPVLFRQRRIGRDERPFTMLKFRTMRPGDGRESKRQLGTGYSGLGNASNRQSLASPSERLTPTGRILRQLSIDELPQLWNVLRGDMSLVGPRPLYAEYLPYYTEREQTRHNVRPGLTGLAQVTGRNRAYWDDRLELDARYVETKSLWLDFRILGRTFLQVLTRRDVMDAAVQGSLAKHRSSTKS